MPLRSIQLSNSLIEHPDFRCNTPDVGKITSKYGGSAAELHDSAAELLVAAETEMAAFYSAVTENYGAAQAELAALDWLREMEQADWSIADGGPNWRSFTYMAAVKLADRICPERLFSYTEDSL